MERHLPTVRRVLCAVVAVLGGALILEIVALGAAVVGLALLLIAIAAALPGG